MKTNAIQYAQAWFDALENTPTKKWSDISFKMLRLLQIKGKLSLLNQIVANMQEMEDQKSKARHVYVTVAHDMDDKKLQDRISRIIDINNLIIKKNIDPGIIGGMIIKTKDKQWDLSLKNRVFQLKNQLSN